jgi:hypothetical protein
MTLPGIDVDPSRGDRAAVRSAAAQFRSRANALTDRAGSARAALGAMTGLVGEAPDALRPRVATLVERIDRTAAAASEVACILDDYATSLDAIALRSVSAMSHAHFAYDQIWIRRGEALNAASELITGWALGWDDVLPSWMYLDDRAYLARWTAAIEDFRDARGAVLALQAERDELDRFTAEQLRAVPLLAELAASAPASLTARLAVASLWAGDVDGISAAGLASLGDPELIRQVWGSMSREQRDALVAASPLVIGNLDGVPLRDRVAANHRSIGHEIDHREAQIAALEAKRDAEIANPSSYPEQSPSSIRAAYDARIAEHRAVILSYRGLLTQRVTWIDENRHTHVDTGARVVVFDPRSQAIGTYHGPIDAVTGDIPAWVRHVAISVPGTAATMISFSDDLGADLYALSGRQSAVFQWAGGEFPGDVLEATSADYSAALAPKLRDFAAGVALPDSATLTVLGHSYGGATVGLAEQAGLKADRVLYVASAGMGHGVSGLSDFPYTADVPHYSLMVRNDLVVGLVQGGDGDALHGQSALNAEGVVRLETGRLVDRDPTSPDLEDYSEPGNGFIRQVDVHTTLFTPNSTAMNGIVAVITGGRAEVFAPSEYYVAGGRSVTVDGIDSADYEPHYTRIE